MDAAVGLLWLFALLTAVASEAMQKAALVGSKAVFGCPRVEGKSEDEIQKWLKGRDTIFEDDGMVMSEKWNQDKFDLVLGESPNYNLTVNEIGMSDKDTYVCLLINLETDEKKVLKEYDLVVLEKPKCEGEKTMVIGESYTYTCSSNVNDVTLLWSVGTGEKNVGANSADETHPDVVYETKKTITADSSLQGQSVDCELQHPGWSVQNGALGCSVGPLRVESEIQITCEENDQKEEGIACVIKARDKSAIDAGKIGWMVETAPGKVTPVSPDMLEPLKDGTGYRVVLSTDKAGERHALKVDDVEGPWQTMPASRKGGEKEAGAQTGLIIAIVVIVVVLLLIVVLFVLYKRKVIFSTSKTKAPDMERGAVTLNGVTHNGDDKTLLDHKDTSNMDDEKRRDSGASSDDLKNNLIIDTKPQKMDNEEKA